MVPDYAGARALGGGGAGVHPDVRSRRVGTAGGRRAARARWPTMEDAVSPDAGTLLPDGVETPFAEIEATMARLAAGDRTRVAAARSLLTAATATVVAVGPPPRLVDAA